MLRTVVTFLVSLFAQHGSGNNTPEESDGAHTIGNNLGFLTGLSINLTVIPALFSSKPAQTPRYSRLNGGSGP